MADVSLRTASEEHFSMGQNRCVWSSCSIAGCRTVLSKKLIRPPPGRDALWPRVLSFALRAFFLFAFLRIWLMTGSNCEEPRFHRRPTDLRRQQPASAATRELLRESSPNRRRVSFLRPEAGTSRRLGVWATKQLGPYGPKIAKASA